jgi:hypothetical protein
MYTETRKQKVEKSIVSMPDIADYNCGIFNNLIISYKSRSFSSIPLFSVHLIARFGSFYANFP